MFGLPDNTIKSMQSVFSRYPEIEQVIIYGSRAKGSYRPGSDIDLTLVGDWVDASCLSKVIQDLDDLNTPYLMDVSVFSELESNELMSHIHRVGKPFFIKESVSD